MNLGIVLFLDPLDELAIEAPPAELKSDRGRGTDPHRSEESFDFSLRRAIAHWRVVEQAADACSDLDNFLRGVNRADDHIERVRHAAFAKGRADRTQCRSVAFSAGKNWP